MYFIISFITKHFFTNVPDNILDNVQDNVSDNSFTEIIQTNANILNEYGEVLRRTDSGQYVVDTSQNVYDSNPDFISQFKKNNPVQNGYNFDIDNYKCKRT